MSPTSEAYNIDCMEAMKNMPDKYFDLAVVDPPYGSGGGEFSDETRIGGHFDKYKRKEETVNRIGGTWAKKHGKKIISWDVAPEKEYFDELFRVSKNQIIWGGNYFDLPPTRCFLIWEKLTISENFSMAMAEYAWTSLNENAKIFKYAPQDSARFHPTQKPVALYTWIFNKYAKPGDKILDTHLGSGSSRVAAWDAGLDFVGFEIDKEYFQKQEERFAAHTAQTSLFI